MFAFLFKISPSLVTLRYVENEASYEEFFLPTSVLSHVRNTLCNIFSKNLI